MFVMMSSIKDMGVFLALPQETCQGKKTKISGRLFQPAGVAFLFEEQERLYIVPTIQLELFGSCHDFKLIDD